LKQLRETGALQKETWQEIVYAFDYLWQLRFYNQITENVALSADADELDVVKMNDIERDNLQSVLSRIPVFQSKLSYDFLGMQI
jgi:signal-transduction protein with cAMP-binding, CBS, and nucleotidyltransferase domain